MIKSIRLATHNDLEFIYKLWNKNSKTLGITWRGMLKQDIDKHSIFILDGIGFCKFNVMKRKHVTKIDAIAINEENRGRGYGKIFIEKLKEFERPIILECVKGADNNIFYQSLGRCYGEKEKKNITLYKFVINEGDDFNDEY